MKLIIEIDVDCSDFSPTDAELFVLEADSAMGMFVEVGTPIDEDRTDGPYRVFRLTTEYFKVRKEN